LPQEPEILADFARYLCVLVSGFMEQAVRELAGECARRQSSPGTHRYVQGQLLFFQNPNAERIAQLIGAFNPDWRVGFELFLGDQRKDAINSIVANRHNIAHGQMVGISYVQMSEYYASAKEVVDYLADLFLPETGVPTV
jgi:hypothetical protein